MATPEPSPGPARGPGPSSTVLAEPAAAARGGLGPRVLVTGATGFTGGHLARRLHAAGIPIRVVARRTSDVSQVPAQAEVVYGDVREPAVLARAVAGVAVVFHIAAAFREARLPAEEYRAINVDASARLALEAARAGCRRFVHCSTGGVHGHVAHPPANEDAPLSPGDWYQETKLRGEAAVRDVAAREGLALTVVRPTGIYGPGDRRILTLFRSVVRRRFVMFGDGQVHYHMTYVDDLVEGLLRCGVVPGAAGRTYLLAGDGSITLEGLVAKMAACAGVPPPRGRWPLRPLQLAAAVCEAACRPFHLEPPLHRRRVDVFVKNRAFDITRARTELGFAPRVSLDDGVQRTYAWYRAAGWL